MDEFPIDYLVAFNLVLGHEGGYQNDREDRGNWTSGKVGVGVQKGTKYGISAMSYPDLDIANLTVEDAKRIYFEDYWKASDADMEEWPMNYLVFDAAVNHGVARSEEFYDASAGNPEEFLVQRMLFFTRIKTWPRYAKGWTRRLIKIAAQMNDHDLIDHVKDEIAHGG
jgi:lysozyme family protein